MSYGPNINDMVRRAVAYVDRILKDTNLEDLPVQRPTRFELVINLKTAKALGLDVPPLLHHRAAEVIECECADDRTLAQLRSAGAHRRCPLRANRHRIWSPRADA